MTSSSKIHFFMFLLGYRKSGQVCPVLIPPDKDRTVKWVISENPGAPTRAVIVKALQSYCQILTKIIYLEKLKMVKEFMSLLIRGV